MMKFSTLILISLLFIFSACGTSNIDNHLTSDDVILKNAFDNEENNIQVHGNGKVIRLLPDDTDGIKHQRFIIQLASKQTLLISHNIDISTKIDILSLNDLVEFYGEYIWNSEGGLVHWTHHDPENIHIDGYLKHKDVTYD